jgi:septal ring factor EnvC (AmiA/AmiB activator)
LQGEQQELQQQLSRLKQQLMAAEASRTEAADALAASEAAISKTNRRLRELSEERAQVEQQIEALQQRSRAVAASESRQQLQLAETLRQQDRLTLRDPFRAFLAGENPAELARDAEYYGYLSRATSARIGELALRRSELQQLAEESTKKRDELAKIAEDESRNKLQLVAEQGRRKEALARLSKQIATQRQSIDKLERDEKRLSALIDQLSRVLAEQARRDAEREAARRAKESAPKAERPATAPTPARPPGRHRPGRTSSPLRTPVLRSCAGNCRCRSSVRSPVVSARRGRSKAPGRRPTGRGSSFAPRRARGSGPLPQGRWCSLTGSAGSGT